MSFCMHLASVTCDNCGPRAGAVSTGAPRFYPLATAADTDAAVRSAASMLMEAALRVLENDPHSWSKRPCSTCETVSSLAGRPFGCVAHANSKR